MFELDLAIKLSDIICDVCNGGVDKVAVCNDPVNGGELITVFCHGDVETVHLTDAMLVDMNSFEFGRAFATKRVNGGTSGILKVVPTKHTLAEDGRT